MGIDSLINDIKGIFQNFNTSIDQAVKIVTTSPQTNSEMWQVVNNVYNIVLPVAFTLAVLYFWIDFLKKSVMLEYMNWDNLFKSLLKVVICKSILQNVLKIMNQIFVIIANISVAIGTHSTHIQGIDYTALKQSFSANTNFLERFMLQLELKPYSFIMWIINIAIIVIVYGRMIQIYIYTALSPIPLASLAGEGMSGTCKKFLQDYAAICLQGVIIIVCFALYGGLIKGVALKGDISGIRDFIMYSAVLLLVLVKSGSWAGKFTGSN